MRLRASQGFGRPWGRDVFRRPLPVTMDAPRLSRAGEARDAFWSEAGALVAFAILVGILLYYAQFSGSMRWFLGVGLIAAFAMFAWTLVVRRTAELVPLVGPTVAGAVRDGDLAALAAATRRASRGLPYSQVLVASRARTAFLERARLALGLSPEAMREVQRDPAALRRMFRDDVLRDFVLLETGDLEERYRWVAEARDRGGFARRFGDVLDRMEAWR